MQHLTDCAGCGASRFPNQLKDVFGHNLCSDCVAEILKRFSCKQFLAGLIRGAMTLGEINRMRLESARAYAGSEVEVG